MKLEAQKKTILRQNSFLLENDQIRLAITETGGNMAPVWFYKNTSDPIQPYYFSPWQREQIPLEHSYMDVFRGDLFCFPFGYSSPNCPFHGQTSANPWTLDSYYKTGDQTIIALHMDLTSPCGRVDKKIALRDGQNNLYITHKISGTEGQYSFSHHATLDVNTERDAWISMSPLKFGVAGSPNGSVFTPHEHGYPFIGKTQMVGEDMHVSTVWKDPDTVDLSHVPVIENFSGVVYFFQQEPDNIPAWTCLWFPQQNYVWYSLKNIQRQPATMLWMEFGGRYQYPWNGRTMCVAVEDMCLAPTRRNGLMSELMEKYGVPYAEPFRREQTLAVHHIQGVAKVPKGFGKVRDILFRDRYMTLIGVGENQQRVPVDWQFCLSD